MWLFFRSAQFVALFNVFNVYCIVSGGNSRCFPLGRRASVIIYDSVLLDAV